MKHTESAALQYANLGLSPISVFSAKRSDEAKRKRPTVQWKPYQDRIATEQEIKSFFRNGADIAVVCGAVSGGVEIIDFDEPSLFQPYIDILKGNDSQLAKKLVTQSTPSGRYHLVYRSEDSVPGNQKLAMSADGKIIPTQIPKH